MRVQFTIDRSMSQIIFDPVERYLDALQPVQDDVLNEVRETGLAAGLPLIHVATGRLLRTLARAVGARRILEIGTAIGYSALWMAPALPHDGLLISMEVNADRAAEARRHFARAGLEERITVIVGDASRFLHKVSGPFDLIFQDGDKRLYEPLLDKLVPLLGPGGILVTDNVLWGGEVVDGFVALPRHDAESTAMIRRYNQRLAGDARLETSFLPVGDGIALSVKV
jgi:caffeoyl-CoA O-methyltransferase